VHQHKVVSDPTHFPLCCPSGERLFELFLCRGVVAHDARDHCARP
jgi:hypothetical protein